jgi:hypothetical protein
MVSYYRINVSKDGYYLFATEQGQLTSLKEAKKVYDILKEKFPDSQGYEVTCTRWEGTGKEIDL